jgi:anaerobic ribonucleoside-triphosphate reductase activating protein
MTAIGISRLHFPVTALGPGRRVGIWFQGCTIRCRGCISADTWALSRSRTSVDQLIRTIAPWLDSAGGATITGGEPFDQSTALVELLHALRERFAGDILVYSGYRFEELASHLAETNGLIDVLISDPFDHTAPQILPLRGSDNQRLHLLTARGAQLYAEYDRPQTGLPNTLDVMFDDDGTFWIAGIPRQHDLSRLRALLERSGHRVVTSEHRSKLVED